MVVPHFLVLMVYSLLLVHPVQSVLLVATVRQVVVDQYSVLLIITVLLAVHPLHRVQVDGLRLQVHPTLDNVLRQLVQLVEHRIMVLRYQANHQVLPNYVLMVLSVKLLTREDISDGHVEEVHRVRLHNCVVALNTGMVHHVHRVLALDVLDVCQAQYHQPTTAVHVMVVLVHPQHVQQQIPVEQDQVQLHNSQNQ